MKHAALTWVKLTIDDSLKQTRQTLEQFVENPSDTAPLQQSVMWLREISGVLKILQLQTAAQLVQEIELTLRFLLGGKIQNNEKTYDILMRALIQLPNYLDHLVIVQQDMPLALLPLLNGLRELRAQPVLQASSLFTPDLTLPIPVAKVAALPDDKVKDFAQKMLAAYQKGLATLPQAAQQAEGIKFLQTVMQRLLQVTGNAQISKIWWVTEALLEAITQKGLALNANVLNLLKQNLALIKQLADHGNAALRVMPPKPLLSNLLYFVAQAKSKGEQVTKVKQTFQLHEFFPSEAELQTARLIFSGPDIELMKIIVTLLKDDFARIEETLDIFNRADNPTVSELEPLINVLREMANTLGLLGLNLQRSLMLKQTETIQAITQGTLQPSLTVMLEIANALLQVSNALDILGVQGVHARQRLQQSAHTQFSETPQFGIVMGIAVDEAKSELAQVIQPIVNFIENQTETEELLAVPERMRQVEGFLKMTNHQRASQLLAQCNHYLHNTFIKAASVPEEKKLKALADMIISIESYLDTLAGSPLDAKELLDIAEKRLTLL